MVRLALYVLALFAILLLGLLVGFSKRVEAPVDEIPVAGTVKSRVKLALPPQAVNGFLNSHGVNSPARDVLEDMLLNEAPPDVDLSTMSVYDIANAFLEVSDTEALEEAALSGEQINLNVHIIEQAETGFAGKKLPNFTDD